jgi:translation initiation factor eIF-2B subunit alpha
MRVLYILIRLTSDPDTFKSFSDLKTELVKQGQQYASEAVHYCDKIAELADGFVKDGSVVQTFFSLLVEMISHL